MTPRALKLFAVLTLSLAAVGCKKKGETEPVNQATSGYPSYPATYDTTGASQQTPPTATSTAAPATTATTAPATAAMATPSDMATPCQDDTPCLTHRCNTAYGRCAWPCQTNNDCVAGNQCVSTVCVPVAVSAP